MHLYEDDTFVEEMIVRKNTGLTLLCELGIVLLALVLAAAVFIFLSPIFPAMLAIIVFAAYLGIKFQGVEYEYCFTNGDLDIDKIMAKRKRKTLVEINHKQIRIMAPYTAEYESVTKDYKVSSVVNTASHRQAAGQWFFIYENNEGQYVFVVFQPSKRLREAMRKYMRSRIKGMDA